MKPVIFLTAFHSFISKNILQTEVLSTLKTIPGGKIILLVQKEKELFFRELYGDAMVEVVGVATEPILNTRRNQRLFFLGRYFIDSFYTRYKQYTQYRLNASRPIRYAAERLLVKIVSRLSFLRPFYRRFFTWYADTSLLEALFDTYKPTFLFSTDAFDHMDELVSLAAQRRGIRLVSMVRSWDNAWSKGLLPIKTTHYIANNTVIREELHSMHGVSERDVFVGGVPQYDRFFRREGIISREDFFARIGVSSAQRLVLFAPAGAVLSDTDGELCQIIDRAIDSGALPRDFAILVRNHPANPAVLPELSSRFRVDTPGKVFSARNLKLNEMTFADIDHLANSLFHADLVVYVATTLGVDSLTFDKPQIIINFDGYQQKPFMQSVKRYQEEDHMKKMVSCGGSWVVTSEADLIHAMNTYLENPALHKEGRQAAIAQQIYVTDGGAGKRIGEHVKLLATAM